MESVIINNPNNYVALICKKYSNHNNIYFLTPVEVSLGKLNDTGDFVSENGAYVIPECTSEIAIRDDNTEYVYALCTSLDEIRKKFPDVQEIGGLLVLYYKEKASNLLMVVNDEFKTKLYITDYSAISGEITGGLKKRISDEEDIKTVNINTHDYSDKQTGISLPSLEKYVKERVLENDEIVEDICTTIALNYTATNPKDMQSLLSIGGTGTGKTETYRAIAEYIGIPLIIYDCNSLTATGYVGDDIKDILKEVYAKSNNDIKVAERSIVLLDEIDKLAATGHHVTDVASQQLLLKFYDGGDYLFEPVKNGPKITMNVSFITKAASGAFPSLFEKRAKNDSMGFQASESSKIIFTSPPTLKELENFGMIRELIGRWDNTFMYKNQTEESLRRILMYSKNSPLLLKKQRYSSEFGCELEISDEFILAFARMALKDERGARCLQSLMAHTFKKLDRTLKIEKDLSGSNIKRKVLINESIIENPGSFKI